jgi:putative nucleotidyltransferase with HDIG domain
MTEQTAVGLWKHSLGCAITAKLLAQKKVMSDPEEASVAGLLHDIGKVVLSVQFPKEYQVALAAARDRSMFLFDAEMEMFKMTHATAGAYFARAWRLPKFVVEAEADGGRPHPLCGIRPKERSLCHPSPPVS